jgi:hypothetical protein
MTTEARPDLEARDRARTRAHLIIFGATEDEMWNCGEECEEHGCDRLTAVLLEHARELEALQRERDEEAREGELALRNLDTAMTERDTALAELAAARAKLDPAREAFTRLLAMAQKPMKSWDAGRCVEAERVEEIAAEALEALA